MSVRRWIRLLGAAAAGALLLSCSVDQWAVTAGHGRLSISIQVPAAARGISTADYTVTGLDIDVTQVATSTLIQTFTWVPADGSAQYDVSVPAAGDYEVGVTHHGVNNGNTVAAFESAIITLQPMVVSVVSIVPGQIGAILVDGSQSGVLYGDFVETPGTLGAPANVLFAIPVNVAQGGNVTHLGLINFDTSAQVRLALYEDIGGTPGNLVVATAATALVAGHQEIPVTATPIPAGNYWVGMVFDNSLNVRGDLSGGNGYRFASHPFADPLPDPFPAVNTFFADRRLNLFVRVN